MQISARAVSDRPGPETKSSWPADARELHPADRVGDDLAVDVDRQRAVHRHRLPVAADHVG
jgi:hypothetical protein